MPRNPKSRKGKTKPAAEADKPLPLAPELFPELNATFYTGDPAEFLRLRIEALSLMALPTEQIAPLLATPRRIGSLEMTPTGPPTDEVRERYIATESVMLFHHAAEMILRLFYAHVEKPDCPWLGMSASTNFAAFKEKVAKSRESGFSESDIAMVFLGGTDPRDAAIAASDEEFAATVDAIKLLLGYSAARLLDESFLYNAAKHGLTTVRVDTSKMSIKTDDDEFPLHNGGLLVYLHGPAGPRAPKDGPKHHISMMASLPDQDLATATMIYHAIADLWQVARRRYTCQSGKVMLFTRDDVRQCISGPVRASGGIMRTTVMELTKKRPDGSLTDIGITVEANFMPRAEGDADARPPIRTVALPIRQRDKQVINPSRRWLLPFSPEGSSRV
ncbi:hypothetical protein R3Q15_09540 [Gordonia amicalis]|uniref:Uncharacterized protein n=1 Tax=Gordonia amicalis TaxID=89053 RepID=A0AAE4U0Q9_9ACTN|nr:hypothetical protein [Gordonia amicalis]MDV6312124.1 hypothetical protein [Gordonia amicalis]